MPPSSLFLAVAAALCGLCGASMTPAARRVPRSRGLYDGGVTQFAPDGTLHQVEYAKRPSTARSRPWRRSPPGQQQQQQQQQQQRHRQQQGGRQHRAHGAGAAAGAEGAAAVHRRSTGSEAARPACRRSCTWWTTTWCAPPRACPTPSPRGRCARGGGGAPPRLGLPIGVGMLARGVNQAQAAAVRRAAALWRVAGARRLGRHRALLSPRRDRPLGNFRLVDGVVAPASRRRQAGLCRAAAATAAAAAAAAAAARSAATSGGAADGVDGRRREGQSGAAAALRGGGCGAASSEQDPDPEQKQDNSTLSCPAFRCRLPRRHSSESSREGR